MKNYLKNKFIKVYKELPEQYLSCGGRFEVLGNHTDHNHGLCVAATCSLSIYAAIKKRDDKVIRIYSEGFGSYQLDVSKLFLRKKEIGKPTALIRGILSYLSKDYQYGGLDIYMKSEVPEGAGVSSSAAFELLIAQTINRVYNNNQIPLMILCKASQYAEREYYGKICGLLDQIGVAYGGLVYIDFKDITNPVVQPLKINLDNYQFLIVNSGSSHAKLSHLYATIPEDMFKVAKYFGKEYLRDVDYADFMKNKQDVIEKCGQLAYERSEHFYTENIRVEKAYQAIKENRFEQLVTLINESRVSSTNNLHNMYVNDIKDSPLEACELIMEASHQKAGVKINGGGFAGSVIALVPKDELDNVLKVTRKAYGNKNVHLVDVRNDIPTDIK